MLSIHTILHPTDFTGPSAAAFHVACALARDYRAHLVISHVATEPLIIFSEVAGIPPMLDDSKEALMAKLMEMEVHDDTLHVTRHMDEGEPAEEILRTAALFGADLIVMGTHGRRGLARLLVGSVAERVMREAACPVLTLRTPYVPAEAAAQTAVLQEAMAE